MAWRLEPTSGPFPGPWEGKDAVSWLWEIYRDGETRRVLIEVSGTAMAMADEYLPVETARARATTGRSEVEKVLPLDDPPRRISLGSTGYVADSPPNQPRPDFLLRDAAGRATVAVEVKNPEVLTAARAVVIRDRLITGNDPAAFRFVLVVSQNSGFLFDRQSPQSHPVVEFPMFDVVQSYYPSATREKRFRGAELEVIVYQWLRDLVGGTRQEGEAEHALGAAGFLETLRGGQVEAQPT